jgi:uncharacterized protein with GYD domain
MMPKYLYKGSYTLEGTRGLLKDGGSKRQAVVEQMMAKAGGSVEAFYYAFGDDDLYLIVDMPDNVTGAAVSLLVNAAGGFTGNTVVLLTPEEMDRATQMSVEYSPPGQ